ncbi:hypothetical protein V8E53_001038 [Lactarius tabidus]
MASDLLRRDTETYGFRHSHPRKTLMTVKIGAFYVGVIRSKFTYRCFLFPFAERVGFESLRKRKNVEKIMASSAQPTRLSKLSFPRYTTSLATTPRVRPTLALYVLRAARGAHQRTGTALNSELDRAPRSNFPVRAPDDTPLLEWAMGPQCSHPHRTAILAARDMATSNAQLETTLTASTQLFAAPHGAPQFRVIRERVEARPRADSGTASAAASGRPEVREVIGDRSAQGEGWVTQHSSVVVRLSVRDRVAVGGGRMYTAVGPRSSEKPPQGATAVRCTKSGALGKPRTPSHTTRHCSDAAVFIPIACFLVRTRHPPDQEWPRPTPPVTERSIRNEAAHGEQIQQNGHRVEQSSSRA